MWEYEHRVGTTAAPEDIWSVWSDVDGWVAWNADLASVVIDGPFTVGSRIEMTSVGQDVVELRLAEVIENEQFVDEARLDGLVIRTTHRVERADGATTVVYRMEITGPAADDGGLEVGPAITADFPQTMAALVGLAETR
jgi:hypothetical protein